ncbi:MAG: hypothetical protein HYY18_03910 [Planctomycetes bacterium]|nr:hypothetical protein [Planctomycetota bacterium]
MARTLIAFAFFEGTAFAAFLFAPLPMEERVPANLLPWAMACAAAFYAVVWPAMEAARVREEEDAVPMGERAWLLAAAAAPFAAAAASLAPPTGRELYEACYPALTCLLAGAAGAYAVRLGGPEFARASVGAGLAALVLGYLGRFHSGATGSLPGEPVTVLRLPSLAVFSLALPAAAYLFRRLRAGRAAAAGEGA